MEKIIKSFKKNFNNEKQDCSLFFSADEIAVTLEVRYNENNHTISLVASDDPEIRRKDYSIVTVEELRKRYNSTKEIYNSLDNSELNEFCSNWFKIYLDGEDTGEIMYEVEELEKWTDEDVIEFLVEQKKG